MPDRLDHIEWTQPEPPVSISELDYVPPAADTCANAITKTLTVSANTWSGEWDASGATPAVVDPVQSCTWGGASKNSASTWWKIRVPEDGRLTVNTSTDFNDSYDTVVTIYPADVGCDSLAPEFEAGCDDDSFVFQSIATALVDAGKDYLVEITAWGETSPAAYVYNFFSYEPVTQWSVYYPSYYMSRHILVGYGSYLYAVGGWRSGTDDATYRYDPSSDNWQALESMPQHYSNTDGAQVGGDIYIPSGYVENYKTDYEGIHYKYIIGEDTWETLAPMTDSPGVEKPIAWGAAAADPSDTAYYYTGGRIRTASNTPLGTALKYTLVSDSWSELPEMGTGRYGHRAAFIGDKLCVIGGVGAGNEILGSGECYDFGALDWSPIASLNIPRYSFGAAVDLDGNWYVFGGLVDGGGTTAKTEVYKPDEGTWTLLDQTWSLHQSREWPAGARLGSKIFAFGGYLPNAGPSGQIVGTLEWLELPFWGSQMTYLPLISNGTAASSSSPTYEPNDSIPLAYGPLSNGSTMQSDFVEGADTEDFFYIQTNKTATLNVVLTNIPTSSNYDLYFYGTDSVSGSPKYLFAYSDNSGNTSETIQVASLPAGRYSIRIKNTWNRHSSEQYKLMVNW